MKPDWNITEWLNRKSPIQLGLNIPLCFKDDDGIDEAVNFWTPDEDDEGEQEKRLLECIKMWLRDTNEEFSD